MTTKGQELKKELAQAFPGLKFSVKTDKGITTRIDVIVTGLMGSPYTMSEIKLITNKYHNYRTHGHNDSHTGSTQVHVKNERSSYLKEIKEMVPNYESNWSTVYKIADNECFTVLPDGYYEEKMSLQNPQSQEVIDSAVIETIEKETIDNTTVKTVKEVKPKNKVAKLQIKLTCLNAQLSITKGNRNKAKLVLEILKVESAIEQLIPEEKEITLTREQEKSLNALTGGKFIFSKLTQESKKELLKIVNELESLEREEYRDSCTGKGLWKKPSEASIKRSEQRSNKRRLLRQRVEQLELIQEKPVEIREETEQSKPVDVPVTKKDEFCKKSDRKTVKLLESRFKDAQIDITETQVILKSETGELAINCSMELPELDYRRRDVIKSLIRQNQNPKIHSVYEYIGSILLTA